MQQRPCEDSNNDEADLLLLVCFNHRDRPPARPTGLKGTKKVLIPTKKHAHRERSKPTEPSRPRPKPAGPPPPFQVRQSRLTRVHNIKGDNSLVKARQGKSQRSNHTSRPRDLESESWAR